MGGFDGQLAFLFSAVSVFQCESVNVDWVIDERERWRDEKCMARMYLLRREEKAEMEMDRASG